MATCWFGKAILSKYGRQSQAERCDQIFTGTRLDRQQCGSFDTIASPLIEPFDRLPGPDLAREMVKKRVNLTLTL